jgi:Zn-dependent peptidase ImmA (M78 family)
MLKTYKPTSLEKSVSDFLIQIDILSPSHLDPFLISRTLGIEYEQFHSPACSGVEEGIPYIITDKRCSFENQREQFFHELGHILRHDGDQNNGMPQSFREYQEWDAHQFTVYVMVPYHMLDFSLFYSINGLMDRFDVPEQIARKRFNQIRRRLYYSKSEPVNEIRRKDSYQLSPYDLSCRSDETKRLIAQLNKQTGVINL